MLLRFLHVVQSYAQTLKCNRVQSAYRQLNYAPSLIVFMIATCVTIEGDDDDGNILKASIVVIATDGVVVDVMKLRC